jgi:hypothetical protein
MVPGGREKPAQIAKGARETGESSSFPRSWTAHNARVLHSQQAWLAQWVDHVTSTVISKITRCDLESHIAI